MTRKKKPLTALGATASPASSLALLDGRLFATGQTGPLAIDPSALGRMWPSIYDGDEPRKPYTMAAGSAIIDIEGPLQKCSDWCWLGYDEIVAAVQQASADPSVRGILLRVSSPGGDVEGCFEARKAIAEAKASSGKPIVAYADECACSAAYLLASVADAIWLPTTGIVGSIGVIAAMVDFSAADRKDGIRVEVIASGDAKTDGHPHVPISEDAIARLRGRVIALASMFASEVATARGMSVEAVLALQATVPMGIDAVKAGIADSVGGLADALGDLDKRIAKKGPPARAAAGARASSPLPAPSLSAGPGVSSLIAPVAAAAPPFAPSPPPPAAPAATRPPMNPLLLAIIAALKLPEGTTETEAYAALAKVDPHTALGRELATLARSDDASKALGVVQGWKAQADQYPAAAAALETAKATIKAHEEAETKRVADAKIADEQRALAAKGAEATTVALAAIEKASTEMRLPPMLRAHAEQLVKNDVDAGRFECPTLAGFLSSFDKPLVAAKETPEAHPAGAGKPAGSGSPVPVLPSAHRPPPQMSPMREGSALPAGAGPGGIAGASGRTLASLSANEMKIISNSGSTPEQYLLELDKEAAEKRERDRAS